MSDKKSRILYILKILTERSDENHQLTMTEIISALADCDILACNKTVSSDIKLLQEFGVDIVCDKSRQNRYFIGNRDFELPELRLLIDAVTSSRFIPKKKSAELVKKLTKLTSRYQAEMLQRQLYIDDRVKQIDPKVFYTVDIINAAIDKKAKISFQYFDYSPEKKRILKHNGHKYIFSPYALIWNGDFYYVLGYSEKHGKIAKFRVDRIVKPMELDEPAVPQPDEFNVAFYAKQVFSMYDNETKQVRLKCANHLMKSVIDRFGEEVQTEIQDDSFFVATVDVSVSPTFFGWVFQFSEDMTILSPPEVQKQYSEKAHKI